MNEISQISESSSMTKTSQISETRYCKKCLLRDMDRNEYFKNLYDYIASIDEDIKAEPQEYERRLELCKNCDNLMDGMCRICGCYVELRAIINDKKCPAITANW